ncbi:MAG: universal stress protein [Deltaproteobacteria bacterium]|nr:universal stress protein [Deltaproteobacteria bacterium]
MLVAVDLTPSADRVLGRVAMLPLAEGARVTLLHVVPSSLPPREQRSAARDALKALAGEARELRAALPQGVVVEELVEIGGAAGAIAARAHATGAELIVMGRGGRRALRDALLGSTAERVVRQARLPVLVVRLRPRHAYRRPALALDLDEAAHAALAMLLRTVPAPRPPVAVIHAFDDPYRRLAYPSLAEREGAARRIELQVEATRGVTRLLDAALARAGVPPEGAPRWKLHVRHGSARLVIEKAVAKADHDLLVLGTQGRAGIAHVFLGTVAGDVLRAVSCDVLVTPPPAP